MAEPDSVALLRRDVSEHARVLTEHTHQLIAVDKAEALRQQADEHLDERLERIERRIDGIHKLGWWILAAFGSSAVALIANFAFRGGFIVS